MDGRRPGVGVSSTQIPPPLDSWWHPLYVDGPSENLPQADSETRLLIHNLRLHVRDLEAQLAQFEGSAPAESDTRLRTVVDSLPLLVWSSDASQRRTWFNRPWLEFTGRTIEQELGFGWTEGVHPDDVERSLTTYRNAFGIREPFQIDYRLRRHDGSWHWVLDRGVPCFDNPRTFSGYVGSCIDITERKQAEAEHREREERIRLAEASSGIGTWDWDLTTDEVSWSPALYNVLGVSENVRPSVSSWEQLVHPDDRQRVAQGLMEALASESVLETEHRIIRPDGTMRWLSTLGRIFRDELGKPIRISGLNIDLTARKQGEQRAAFLLTLEDATRQLTEPHDITQTAAALLGEHLRVNRCAYADVEEDQDTFNLTGDFNYGVPSIVGRYTFTQFGTECLRLMRLGEPYIVEDSETDERVQPVSDSYRQTFIRSVICVPLHKRGRFAAAMAVHSVTP
ncbi:MAG: PAS domain-containing protein, partial [Bryobacteraceae bacterium]